MAVLIDKELGQVFTPRFLVDNMLDKLPNDVWANPHYKWLDPACGSGNFLIVVFERLMVGLSNAIKDENKRKEHILNNMIFGVDLDFPLCYQARQRLSCPNIYCTDSLNYNFEFDKKILDHKFDIIVGNPPYNTLSENKGIRNILWDKFVKLSIDLLRDRGYLVFVHPSGWRGSGKFLKSVNEILSRYQMLYLEMHSVKEGIKTFNCHTTYDWYVLQKVLNYKKTLVKGQDGIEKEIQIEKGKFLPNGMFDFIFSLMAINANDRLNVVYDNSCHTQKDSMSKIESKDFKYPCLYAVNVDGIPTFWYSKNPIPSKISVPKLVFSGGFTSIYAKKYFLDETGEYGLTQFSRGIIDSKENLQNIEKAMASPRFKEIMWMCILGKGEINAKVFSLFRKDFWKEFV